MVICYGKFRKQITFKHIQASTHAITKTIHHNPNPQFFVTQKSMPGHASLVKELIRAIGM